MYTIEDARKVLSIVDAGLIKGLGRPEPGPATQARAVGMIQEGAMGHRRRKSWRGACPECGKVVSLLTGTGPYAQGRGETVAHKRVLDHGVVRAWCRGGYVPEKDRNRARGQA